MARDKLYRQVVNFLREQIDNGQIKIGEAIYSENLLCEKLGVSRTSVRRAIRQMVEENILVSHQGKGTFVKGGVTHNAVCLVNHHRRRLMFDPTDRYYADIIFSSETASRDRDFDFQVFSRILESPDDAVQKLSKLKVDGLLIDGAFQDYYEDLSFFRRVSQNLVLIEGNPLETDLPTIVPELAPCFEILLKNAAARGGKIAWLSHDRGVQSCWWNHEFTRAAEKLNLDYEYCDYGQNITKDNFRHLNHGGLMFNAIEKFMTPENIGGTIFCANDYAALRVVNFLARRGYRAPDDFAVCGCGGILFSQINEPAITTIKIDTARMGELAAEELIRRLNGGNGEAPRLSAGILWRETLTKTRSE